MADVRISFVCSGNICRSPTAEAVMRGLAEDAGRGDEFEVESAGTGGWHAGDDMDPRARAELVARGYDVPRHRARQFDVADFDRLDLVVALDGGHFDELRDLAPDDEARSRVVRLGSLGPKYRDDPDVPDPYYGGPDGFRDVFDRIEDGCRVLLANR